jgi:hypothetical protein
MPRNGNRYEYIAIYIYDQAIAMIDPAAFIEVLKSKYKFQMKGTGPLEFHLGDDFYCDKSGCLGMAP